MKIDCKVILSGEKVVAKFWEQRSWKNLLASLGSLGEHADLYVHIHRVKCGDRGTFCVFLSFFAVTDIFYLTL